MENTNRDQQMDPRNPNPENGENTNPETEQVNDNNDKESSGARRKDEQTNTSGYGSAQRSRKDNVGPLESDLSQLPSEKRRERGI